MLAIQPPKAMGSTQPGDVDLPFGYSVDQSHEFLFLEAPEPAPGQPLLSENESKALSSFFEDMTADNYNTSSFSEALNFSDDWLNLPPQFMGHTTSFGQQPGLPSESPAHGPGTTTRSHDAAAPSSSSFMPPPPPSHHHHPSQSHHLPHHLYSHSHHHPAPAEQQQQQQHPPSADVLAAATLLQTSSRTRTSASNHDRPYGGRDLHSQPRPSPPPPVGHHHPRHQPTPDFRRDDMRISQPHPSHHSHPAHPAQPAHEATNEHMYADMLFGTASRTAPAPCRQNPVDVQWGSDKSFGRPSFIPSSEKVTSEALEKEAMAYMDCLEVNNSAATTGPSSPARNGSMSPLRPRTKSSASAIKLEDDDADGPPRKRRKSRVREDTDEDDDSRVGIPPIRTLVSATTSTTVPRKRRSKVSAATGVTPATAATDNGPLPPGSSPATIFPPEAQGRRKKSLATNGGSHGGGGASGGGGNGGHGSSAASSKTPRENLTEEQKRENHIRSEQKRRTLIKEGFDDLCDMVPGLKGGGFSKSTMLAMAAEWLEDLLAGNAELQAKLGEGPGPGR